MHTGRVGPCWWIVTQGVVTPDIHAQIVQTTRAWTASTTPSCLLHIAHDVTPPSAAERSELASVVRNSSPLYLRGFALVTNSALVRGALMAINWMAKSDVKQGVFAKPKDGLSWLRERHPDVDVDAVEAAVVAAAPRYPTWLW